MSKKFLTSKTGGRKEVKQEMYALIPTEPLAELARLYGYGAGKYSERNWEKGYAFSASYSALQRHANQFWAGENVDPESGCSHLAAVCFHAFAMLEFLCTHPEYDDRPHQFHYDNLFKEFLNAHTRSKASTGSNRKVRAQKSQTRNSSSKGR